MRRLAYDTETDGFLDVLTKIHCLSIRDLETKEEFSFADHCQTHDYPDITEGLAMLSEADEVIAHNGIAFDSAAISKCHPSWTYKTHGDTMVLSRAWFPALAAEDRKRFGNRKFPAHLLTKTHSLAAWGFRLGNAKATYEGGFERWTPEMHSYMRQDTAVLVTLIEHLDSLNIPSMVSETELELAVWLREQKRYGFKFDTKKAVDLYAHLVPIRAALAEPLKDRFTFWYAVDGPAKTFKRTARFKREHLNADDGVRELQTQGAEFQKIKQVFFNPGSRAHIHKVLVKHYGWEPQEFTDNGAPKVTDDVIGALSYDIAPAIARYLMIGKRIGQLAEGPQAWLKLVTQDNFIHGSMNQSGAVTHRATHSHPNVSQVPSVQVASGQPLLGEAGLYGWESRELFTAPEGFTLVGADASGLELRCLGHYMAKYDAGAYINLILNGDIHQANWEAGKPWLTTRLMSKTFIYAFLYGAGNWKLGTTCRPHAEETKKVSIGANLRKTFLKNVPALDSLLRTVAIAAGNRGWVRLPTGHIVPVRHPHAALNSLLQGTGAVICKRWIFHLQRALAAEGLKIGWKGDYSPCAWSHDEVQVAVRMLPGLPELIGKIATSIFPIITDELKFRCPLAGEFKIGPTWAHTH